MSKANMTMLNTPRDRTWLLHCDYCGNRTRLPFIDHPEIDRYWSDYAREHWRGFWSPCGLVGCLCSGVGAGLMVSDLGFDNPPITDPYEATPARCVAPPVPIEAA